MIVLIVGLLMLLCLTGAGAALLFEQHPRQVSRRDPDREPPLPRPWTQVEQGPDSLYPSGSDQEKERLR